MTCNENLGIPVWIRDCLPHIWTLAYAHKHGRSGADYSDAQAAQVFTVGYSKIAFCTPCASCDYHYLIHNVCKSFEPKKGQAKFAAGDILFFLFFRAKVSLDILWRFTWNLKTYFLSKIIKKYISKCRLLQFNMIGALRVNHLFVAELQLLSNAHLIIARVLFKYIPLMLHILFSKNNQKKKCHQLVVCFITPGSGKGLSNTPTTCAILFKLVLLHTAIYTS